MSGLEPDGSRIMWALMSANGQIYRVALWKEDVAKHRRKGDTVIRVLVTPYEPGAGL